MKIKALVMDVDGTLTDGGIYMGEKGEVMKRFDVKDGYAIRNMLPQMDIIPIIITGRTSQIVLNRCNELEIKHVVQGSQNKIKDLIRVLEKEKIDLSEVAYIGDDMNDYECMKMVELRGCPNDAVDEIKEISECITKSAGGKGAVREFIGWILARGND